MAVSIFPKEVFGTTSPNPRVKKVVPLIYTYVPKSAVPCGVVVIEPDAQLRSAKPTISPVAQRMISRSMESGPKKPSKESLRFREDISLAIDIQKCQAYRKKRRASLNWRVIRRGSTMVSKASPRMIRIRIRPSVEKIRFMDSPLPSQFFYEVRYKEGKDKKSYGEKNPERIKPSPVSACPDVLEDSDEKGDDERPGKDTETGPEKVIPETNLR
jgi:hypothetical protein